MENLLVSCGFNSLKGQWQWHDDVIKWKHLCGEFTGPGEFPTQRPVTRSFDVFFDLRLNKRLSKQPWGWWFETPSWSLWRHCNGVMRNGFRCRDVITSIRYLMRGINGEKLGLKYLNVGKNNKYIVFEDMQIVPIRQTKSCRYHFSFANASGFSSLLSNIIPFHTCGIVRFVLFFPQQNLPCTDKFTLGIIFKLIMAQWRHM